MVLDRANETGLQEWDEELGLMGGYYDETYKFYLIANVYNQN